MAYLFPDQPTVVEGGSEEITQEAGAEENTINEGQMQSSVMLRAI